jgi:hypothetical protein
MIRIRYRSSNEFSPGLHAEAEQRGRRTTVYLLSGLTAAQRRSVLRRLRLTARMGHCPRLPAGQLAFALLMDRIRTGIGRTGAVLRVHPAGSTVPIMVLSGGAIAFLLFSTVSIHVLRPGTTGQSAAGTPPVASASAIELGRGPDGRGGSGDHRGLGHGGGGPDARKLTQPSGALVTTAPVLAAGDGGAGGSAGSGSAGSGSTGSGGTGSGGTGSAGSATNSGSSGGGGTTLSGSASQSPATPTQATPAGSAEAVAPTAPATPAPSSSGSSSGTSSGACVDVGPLGVCLNI